MNSFPVRDSTCSRKSLPGVLNKLGNQTSIWFPIAFFKLFVSITVGEKVCDGFMTEEFSKDDRTPLFV